MAGAPKDTRTPAEKARDTENIVASWMQEGYVPTPEAEAVHAQVARGEITSEEAIEIFRERALELDRKLSQAKSAQWAFLVRGLGRVDRRDRGGVPGCPFRSSAAGWSGRARTRAGCH